MSNLMTRHAFLKGIVVLLFFCLTISIFPVENVFAEEEGETNTTEETTHTHDWDLVSEKITQQTTTQTIYTLTYSCECGETKTETQTVAHTHTFEFTSSVLESQNGYQYLYLQTYTCSVCGQTQKSYLTKTVITPSTTETTTSTESSLRSVDTAGVTYYSSISKAAEYIAKQAKSRNADLITIYLLSSTEVDLSSFKTELMDEVSDALDSYTEKNLGTRSYSYSQTEYAEGFLIKFSVKFSYTADITNEDYVSEQVSSIISSLDLTGKSDYAKAKAIYDWICQNISYDYSSNSERSTVYGALKNRKAICQGYALLYYTLATEAGLSCYYISGTSYGSAHAWNIVKINGTWYNLDSTWDAGDSNYAYFLRGTTFFYKNHTPNSTKGCSISETDYSGASTSTSGNSIQKAMEENSLSVDTEAAEEETNITASVTQLTIESKEQVSLPTIQELLNASSKEYFNTAYLYKHAQDTKNTLTKNKEAEHMRETYVSICQN